MGSCYLSRLNVLGDDRGSLIALEGALDVSFDIARAYFIYETVEGVVRGNHAHLELYQTALCVSGSCIMVLDDGSQRREVSLDGPDIALHIGPMIWREMHSFSPDCVLLVLASEHYDEADYIRDYGDFLRAVEARAKT